MAKLVVMYKEPKDKGAFDKYYFSTHVPLAKKLPGLRNYEVSTATVASPAGASGIHLVATLSFDSMNAIQSAFASPEGKAAAGDIPNFADGGADMYMYETKDV